MSTDTIAWIFRAGLAIVWLLALLRMVYHGYHVSKHLIEDEEDLLSHTLGGTIHIGLLKKAEVDFQAKQNLTKKLVVIARWKK